jgi:hypothetical protein
MGRAGPSGGTGSVRPDAPTGIRGRTGTPRQSFGPAVTGRGVYGPADTTRALTCRAGPRRPGSGAPDPGSAILQLPMPGERHGSVRAVVRDRSPWSSGGARAARRRSCSCVAARRARHQHPSRAVGDLVPSDGARRGRSRGRPQPSPVHGRVDRRGHHPDPSGAPIAITIVGAAVPVEVSATRPGPVRPARSRRSPPGSDRAHDGGCRCARHMGGGPGDRSGSPAHWPVRVSSRPRPGTGPRDARRRQHVTGGCRACGGGARRERGRSPGPVSCGG